MPMLIRKQSERQQKNNWQHFIGRETAVWPHANRHGWKEHLKGFDSYEDSQIAFEKILNSGGTLYDYIEQLEVPESVKNQLISYYEDDWIFNHLKDEPIPAHEDFNTRLNWIMQRRERIKRYKKDHPKYKEEIKNFTINEAKSKQK